MIKIRTEKGVGMIEVLVALLLLAIGVMGFTALQLKAVEATDEAMSKIEAMNVARDVAERIRVNKSALTTYITEFNQTTQKNLATSGLTKCLGSTACSAVKMAEYDTAQVISLTDTTAMKIALPNCHVTGSIDRVCVYVSWGDTKPINHDTDKLACTAGGAYLPEARCIVMELY